MENGLATMISQMKVTSAYKKACKDLMYDANEELTTKAHADIIFQTAPKFNPTFFFYDFIYLGFFPSVYWFIYSTDQGENH